MNQLSASFSVYLSLSNETVSNAEALGNLSLQPSHLMQSKHPAVCANLMQQGSCRFFFPRERQEEPANLRRDP